MIWDVEPILLKLGPVELRYYSLMFIIGFVLMEKNVKSKFKAINLDPNLVSTLTSFIIIGMLVGARLAHCLFYDPHYYLSRPLEILYVWQGGLASHGGYAGVLIAVTIFLKKYPQITFLKLMDIIAGPCLFVGGLIRIGNLFNSEIIGKPSSVAWAIIFKKVDTIPRHPAQIYESIGYFTISFILFHLYKTYKDKWKSGYVLATAIILSFSFRFFIEFFKDNQSTISKGSFINMGQMLSIAFVMVGIILVQFIKKKNQKNS